MIGRVWLHDGGGVWLNAVTDESGMLIADICHAPGIFAPLNSTVRIEGVISVGESLVTIESARWTVLEDESAVTKERAALELELAAGAHVARVEFGESAYAN